jgi:hypothetical protein
MGRLVRLSVVIIIDDKLKSINNIIIITVYLCINYNTIEFYYNLYNKYNVKHNYQPYIEDRRKNIEELWHKCQR